MRTLRWLAYYLRRPRLVLAHAAMRWPARGRDGATLLMWRAEHRGIVVMREHEARLEALNEMRWENLPQWERDLIYEQETARRAGAVADVVEQS